MNPPHTLTEIVSALEANAREITSYFGALPPDAFFAGDATHWGPAHHLSHLTTGHRRVGRGLGNPGALPPHAPQRSRTFDEVRAAYAARMAQVPAAELLTNPLPPRIREGASQGDLVSEFDVASAAMRLAASRWSERECDARAMPHPFLGWLSAREMLLFFVHHDRLHLEGARRRAGGA